MARADDRADNSAVGKTILKANRDHISGPFNDPARDVGFVQPTERQVELIGLRRKLGDAGDVLAPTDEVRETNLKAAQIFVRRHRSADET